MQDLPTTTPLDGTFYRYYFVGHGAQFRVYAVFTLSDKPTGRVIKVPLDFEESKQAIWEPLRLLGKHSSDEELDILADARTREIMQFKHDMPNLVQGILGRDRNFTAAVGNLKILQTPIPVSQDEQYPSYQLPVFFTQDYVATLDSYLQHFRMASNKYTRELDDRSIQALKHVVKQLIELNYLIWEYGIFEFVFKPENFGIRFTQHGTPQLIWMDLAEHITNLEQAETILKERRWLHPLMPHKVDYQFMPAILHDHYAEACNKAFTVEELRKRWRKRCQHAEHQEAKRLRLKEITTRDRKKAVNYWIARHNLSTSLYRGFSDESIDDMEIPVADLQLLLNDRQHQNPPDTTFVEEKIERQMAASDPPMRLPYPVPEPSPTKK